MQAAACEMWGRVWGPPGPFKRREGYWTKPADEKLTGLFTKLTEPKSQREHWYEKTLFIAEWGCTLSNAGFFYVGWKNSCPELIFAGTASVLSHAIPKQWLLTVDKIGVVLVTLKFVREYQSFIHNPWLLTPLAAAAIINASDVYLARVLGKTWGHVVWHFSSAMLAHIALQGIARAKDL